MTAPGVLFLHGSGAGPDVWAVQLPRFEGSRAVWLFDPDDGPLPDTPAAAAERVLPAVERMDAPRVLVGHSLGGAVALQLAAAAPGVVDGLVLIATGARLPVPDDALERAVDDIEGEARRLTGAAFADPTGPLVERARAAIVEGGSDALASAYRACRAHDMRERLGDITAPALVVAGARDPLTPPWLSSELAEGLPSAHLVVLAAGSHMVITENGADVNLLLAGFLARLELTLAGL